VIDGSLDVVHTRRLRAMADSAQAFAEASPDLQRVLEVVARRFAELVGEAVNIRLIEGDALVPVVTHHREPEIDAYLREFHDTTPLRVGEGISGHVLATGEPYFEPVLDLPKLKERLAPGFHAIFDRIGIRGMIVARLRARSVNLGYVSLFRLDPSQPPYDLDDLAMVRDLADRAALAIDNARLVASLEQRVAARTAALESANRELQSFAYSVSHDLRAPLRGIEGFASIIEEDHGSSLHPEVREHLTVIRKSTDRMSRLIDGLLRLSQVGHRALGPIALVDMEALARDVMADVRRAYPAPPIELERDALPHALGNADLLRQVWTNLLGNAVKYSGRKSVARVEVRGVREGGELRYTVTDHGAGFDPRYASKLFGTFQRMHSEEEFEGTGVGLALVQRIVTRHGGRVWADARLGEGATFGFALPEGGPPRE
jgi:signal transduction histidine kinase